MTNETENQSAKQGSAQNPDDVTRFVPSSAISKPELTRQQKIIREVTSWVVLIGIIVILRSSVFGHFLIPSPSMLPSIKTGDHVFANKLAYGLMLPFAESQVTTWAYPKRGDIVLFKSKQQDITLIKRVIGIGGDVVNFKRGTLQINGTPVKEELQSDRSTLSDAGAASDDKNLYIESGLGSHENDAHFVMRQKFASMTESDSKDYVVPQDQLLVMGDNRDDSNDGRFWGFIDVNKVYGKALFITFSTDPTAPGMLPTFRTDRFFQGLK